MGYLFCRNCRHYYKLAEGESPDDFDSCECGAPLEYYPTSSEFIHASRTQVPVTNLTLSETRRKEDKYIETLVKKSTALPTFNKSVIYMVLFTFLPFYYGYVEGNFPLLLLASFAPLLAFLLFIIEKNEENINRIFFIYGFYTLITFIMILLWSINTVPQEIERSLSHFSYFNTPDTPLIFAALMLFQTLLFPIQFLRAYKSGLIDPFETFNPEFSLFFNGLLFITICTVLTSSLITFLGY